MILEIACNDIASVEHAYQNGADRVELCANLLEGGVTPSLGTMAASKAFPLPIYAMIRPRGGDFTYNAREIEVIRTDIDAAKQVDLDGIVFGALKADGSIDVALCEQVITWWGKPITFHRAFDVCKDLKSSLEVIIDLGFERVLTSGGRTTAIEGKSVISDLVRQSEGRIQILAGAGINSQNVREIGCISSLEGVHTTAKYILQEGQPLFSERMRSNPAEIEALRVILDEMHG